MALPLFFGTCTFSHLCDELVMWSSNKWMSFIFSHLELKKYSLRLVFLKIIWNSLCKKNICIIKKGIISFTIEEKDTSPIIFFLFSNLKQLSYLFKLKRYQFYFYMYILYHNSNHMILFSLSKIIPLYDFLFLRISKSGNDCEKKCSMTT